MSQTELITGPVLLFRGASSALWRLSALAVTAAGSQPPELVLDTGERYAGARLSERGSATAWIYEFSVSRERHAEGVGYALAAVQARVYPPPPGGLRVAFSACNGHSEDAHSEDGPERNERWRDIWAKHEAWPFHLLLQGGDQIYADQVWTRLPALPDEGPRSRRNPKIPVDSGELSEAARDFYFEAYCRLWAQPALARVLASVPSLMIWDDHDIFDGWGSYRPEYQSSPVFQSLWPAARQAFATFQLGARPEALPEGFGSPEARHFGWAYRIDDTLVLAPDLRTQRSRDRVMAEDQLRWLIGTLERASDCQRVLLVSSVPLVNVSLSWLERFLDWLPGQQWHEDDLIDQWTGAHHREEWSKLLLYLAAYVRRTGVAMTLLSGEIHLGARGVLSHPGGAIDQLIASGVVHGPPPGALVRVYEWLARYRHPLTPGVEVRLEPMPKIGRYYLAERNWLALDLEPGGGASASWHAESSSGALGLTLSPAG